MPRRHDFDSSPTPEQYRVHGQYLPFLEDGKPVMRMGKGELSYDELWPDGIKSMISGKRHQYELRSIEGQPYYENGHLDEMHAWLSENVAGRWHWHESLINNYRSVGFDVYIADEADRAAFEAKWGWRFERNERAFARNALLDGAAAIDEAGSSSALAASDDVDRDEFAPGR